MNSGFTLQEAACEDLRWYLDPWCIVQPLSEHRGPMCDRLLRLHQHLVKIKVVRRFFAIVVACTAQAQLQECNETRHLQQLWVDNRSRCKCVARSAMAKARNVKALSHNWFRSMSCAPPLANLPIR
jgi:hypothetical protein